MRALLLVGLLAFSTAFAGCSDDGARPDATAKSGLSAADRAARDWSEGAALVAIMGVELKGVAEELEGAPPEVTTAVPRDDRQVGDGRAPAWMYVYRHEDHLYLVTVSSGKVAFANETSEDGFLEPLDGGTGMPLGGFELDSDEAAEAAAADANLSAALEEDEAIGIYALSFDAQEGAPVWAVIVEGPGGSAFMRVSAQTGELLASGEDYFRELAEEALKLEAGMVEDTSTVLQDGGGEFVVSSDGHAAIGFLATAPSMAPLSSLTLTITGPDGAASTLEVSNEAGATPATVSNTLVVPMPTLGTWTVSASLSQGVSQSWTLEWCTDGAQGDAAPNGACMP